MPAQKGAAFLLKIGDGNVPTTYFTVAGLRTTQMSINGDPIVITSKDSGGWRDILSGAGTRSVSVSAAVSALGEDLRAASRQRVEQAARTVEVRAAAPLGVCFLPAFVLLGIVPMTAGVFAVLGPLS